MSCLQRQTISVPETVFVPIYCLICVVPDPVLGRNSELPAADFR